MKNNSTLKKITKFFGENSYILVFLLILAVYVVVINATGQNFNFGHISTILSSQFTVIVGTIALGMALIIITGQIDLSVGSILVVTTSCAIAAYNLSGGSFIAMLLAALASGLICGTINALFVGIAKMPPFIVTLGTQLIYRSLALSVVSANPTDLSTAAGISSGQFKMLSDFGSYEFLRMTFGTGGITLGAVKIPYLTILFILLAVLFIIITKKTKYGKAVFAVGSNEKAARLTGINTTWIKMSCFIIVGALCGVAGVMQACKMSNVNPASSGKSYEMYAIASIVLGGVSMAGGKGKILGVIFGAMSYCTVNTIIAISGLPITLQDAFQGIVLIVVIFVQCFYPVVKEKIAQNKKRKENERRINA